MSELSQGQMQYLHQLQEKMSAQFVEPKYQPYRLIYTTDPRKADVTISQHHTILDYLAIGIVALAKKSNQDDPVIVAMHNQTMNKQECCKAYIGPNSHVLYQNALMGIRQQIDSIVANYMSYPGFSPFGIGMSLPFHFTCIHMGYLEDHNFDFEFENFNDVLAAQKLAFSNLKLFTISSYLGALEAAMSGED